MKTSCYLVVNKTGDIKFTKTSYTAKIGSIPIKINIEIPDSAFREPVLQGTLKVSEEQFNNTLEELEFELKTLIEKEKEE